MTIIIAVILCYGIGQMVDIDLKNRLRLETQPKTVFIVIVIDIILLMHTTNSEETLKAMMIIQIMIHATYCDATTKKIDRRIHIMIMGIGAIMMPFPFLLREAIPGLLLMPIPFLLTGLYYNRHYKKSVIGTGDIYYVGALGFALGLTVGINGMINTMILALVMTKLLKLKNETIAFIPYISMGYIITILLTQ